MIGKVEDLVLGWQRQFRGQKQSVQVYYRGELMLCRHVSDNLHSLREWISMFLM